MGRWLTAILVLCISTSSVLAGQLDGRLEQLITLHETKGGTVALDRIAREGIRLRGPSTAPLVPVIITPEPNREPTSFSRGVFQAVGGTLDATSRSYLRVLAPIGAIRRLATIPGVATVSIPAPPQEAHGTGVNVSESVDLTGAEDYHQLNTTGAGVRVAVVDLGFANLTNAKNAGEIPASAIGYDFTGTGLEATTNHGTGVAEHVADMAPAAQLYLLKIGDLVDLQNAVAYIQNNNIQIVNHSVAWFTYSYYDGSGAISNEIFNSVEQGKFWAVAAGNYARRHWRGVWTDTNANDILEFSGADELLALQGSASPITLYLNWNQYSRSIPTQQRADLNLYVKDNNGAIVASSTIDNRFNDPVEVVSINYDSARAPYSVEIRNARRGSVVGLDITLFSANHDVEYRIPAASIADPASSASAFTVAAINKTNWQLANPSPSSYSSQGPTTNNIPKPDIAAPDCTRSLTYGAQSCGTSFASPTIAGAAALVLEANPGLTPSELKARLESMTIPPATQ